MGFSMGEKRSVYLTEQTLGAVRRLDSLSGRINQVAARYAAILALDGPSLRARFNSAQWASLLTHAWRWREIDAPKLPIVVRRDLGGSARGLTDAQLVLLADMAEGDL